MEKLVKIVYDGDRGGDVMLTVKTKEAHDDWAVLSISKNPDDDYESKLPQLSGLDEI